MSEKLTDISVKGGAPRIAVPIEDAADMLNCSHGHVRKLILVGKLKICPSSRHKRILLASLLPLVGMDVSVLYRCLAEFLVNKNEPSLPAPANVRSEDGHKSS
jgi:hypothetical protein